MRWYSLYPFNFYFLAWYFYLSTILGYAESWDKAKSVFQKNFPIDILRKIKEIRNEGQEVVKKITNLQDEGAEEEPESITEQGQHREGINSFSFESEGIQ